MNSPSIGQLITTSSPNRRWHSMTPMMLGKPPSALIATMFGHSSSSRRIAVTGMSDGWMRVRSPTVHGEEHHAEVRWRRRTPSCTRRCRLRLGVEVRRVGEQHTARRPFASAISQRFERSSRSFQLEWWKNSCRPFASSAAISKNWRYSGSVIVTSETSSVPSKPCSNCVRTSWRMPASLSRKKIVREGGDDDVGHAPQVLARPVARLVAVVARHPVPPSALSGTRSGAVSPVRLPAPVQGSGSPRRRPVGRRRPT